MYSNWKQPTFNVNLSQPLSDIYIQDSQQMIDDNYVRMLVPISSFTMVYLEVIADIHC